jgi:hypothetical protein
MSTHTATAEVPVTQQPGSQWHSQPNPFALAHLYKRQRSVGVDLKEDLGGLSQLLQQITGLCNELAQALPTTVARSK